MRCPVCEGPVEITSNSTFDCPWCPDSFRQEVAIPEQERDAEADLIAEWLDAEYGEVHATSLCLDDVIAKIRASEHRAWDKRRKDKPNE